MARHKTRIVGGWKVEENTYPWQVFIEHPSKPSTGPSCGGSLITNQHVITAKHCVDEKLFDPWDADAQKLHEFLQKYPWYFRVSLGDHHWKDNKFKFVTVSKITLHQELDNETCGGGHDYKDSYEYPGYDIPWENEENNPDYLDFKKYLEYDVAILTLSQKIKLNSKISPICLPADNREKSYAGQTGQVSGWGIDKDNFNSVTANGIRPDQPHELLVANVNIISNEACNEIAARNYSDKACAAYKCSSKCDGDTNECQYLECENAHPEEMCTTEHGSTCQGDSGGPLFLKEQHKYESPEGRRITVRRYFRYLSVNK